jgi:ASC-1-like (ASCH) protein
MNHIMSLNERPFDLIRQRRKTIEVRCNDEKRRQLRVGDTITFYKLPDKAESIEVEVSALYPFGSFEELYGSFDFSEFGCEGYTMRQMLDSTRNIYSREKEEQYGALGIRIKLIGGRP